MRHVYFSDAAANDICIFSSRVFRQVSTVKSNVLRRITQTLFYAWFKQHRD